MCMYSIISVLLTIFYGYKDTFLAIFVYGYTFFDKKISIVCLFFCVFIVKILLIMPRRGG